MRKEILLTFDYELFLGSKSGSAESCMLLPTQRILKVLGEYNAKAIFFVDTTYLWKFKNDADQNSKHQKTLNEILEQVKRISENHYVYLHIHPHWLDAIYDSNFDNWDLSNVRYFTINNLDANTREKLLHECYTLLQQNSLTKVEGYRAGGLFVQPFSTLKSFLESTQIP
jgi:hypothetical protein